MLLWSAPTAEVQLQVVELVPQSDLKKAQKSGLAPALAVLFLLAAFTRLLLSPFALFVLAILGLLLSAALALFRSSLIWM